MFRFLELPETVRKTIFRLHLDVPRQRNPVFMDRKSRRTLSSSVSPLLLVCKQISNESLSILYGEIHLVFSDTHSMHDFLHNISLRARRLIQTLSFNYWGGKINKAFELLKQLKHLKDLYITLDRDSFYDWEVPREHLPDLDELGFRYGPMWQLGFKALLLPGMDNLRTLRGLRSVHVAMDLDNTSCMPSPAHYQYVISDVLSTELTRPRVGYARPANTGTFRFLDLPPELRRHIYILRMKIRGPMIPSKALPTSAYHCLTGDSCKLIRKQGPVPPSVLAMLEVSRQIYSEALPYFYSLNHFWLISNEHMCSFLDGIGSERCQFLRKLTFYWASPRWSFLEPRLWFEFYNFQPTPLEALEQFEPPDFDRLVALKHLQDLGIVFNNIVSFERVLGCKIGDIPGMDNLRSIRGLKVLEILDSYSEVYLDAFDMEDLDRDEPDAGEKKSMDLEQDLRSLLLLPREEPKAVRA